ncbi:DUF2795 domain-containing protein [Rhodovulum sp. 12E13]|uniref:DUF2795 domain-containing protein n=1 Tax=Rhodovulum sp. 12E13 TaxID=2203891 RepID=UPI0018F50CE9|nr:DUF2795 domain-containing protein [Rhodovulum sp. 12E13]
METAARAGEKRDADLPTLPAFGVPLTSPTVCEAAMTQMIETGEIHFFYRPKIDVYQPSGVDDLQRMYLALVPDDRDLARLFIVGRKQLPDILAGEADPSERHWLLLAEVGTPVEIGEALRPVHYETKTRGERQTPQAIPVGSGRYVIAARDDSTQIAYRLRAPKTVGAAQEALNIQDEARFVIAVRNPSVKVPGFPDAQPDYPSDLSVKFADERWIDISDSRLLDHEDAQLVLIGAEEQAAPLEIGANGKADPFATFGLAAGDWPDDPLESGAFAAATGDAEPVESEGDRSKGGRRGGPVAARTDSAAGVTSALTGISFPSDRAGLVRQARDNDAPDEVIDLIENMPERRFETMADVSKAVGEVR